jgi:hypothetical protein
MLRLFEVNNATLERGRSSLCSVRHAQLAEEVIDMTLYCGFADVQDAGYFLVTPASDNFLEYLKLPARQI